MLMLAYVVGITTINASGQKNNSYPSVEELQKTYPNHAGVTLDYKISSSIEVNKKTGELEIWQTEYEEVIYINDAAKYYNDQSLTTSDFFEEVTEVTAVAYDTDGKKHKLKDEDFSRVDAERDSWVFHDENKQILFEFDKIDVGYKTIITNTKKIKKPEFFDVFHFVQGFPALNATIEVIYSDAVSIKFYERAFEKFNIEHQKTTLKKGMIQETWNLKNVPGYRYEDGAINMRYSIPHVVAQIQEYKSDGSTKTVMKDINDLHQYFQEFLLAKGDESNRGELNKVVRSITADMDSEEDKIDTIFNWVQSNIKYIAFEDGINGYVPRSCSEVMKNRFGDCKDMGNLLVEMLEYAGVENAYVAWVGTRDIPYKMSEIAVPFTCNHVICVVEKEDGSFYYLDATNSESNYKFPPESIQGKDLLIHLGKDKFKLHDVPVLPMEHNYFKCFIRYEIGKNDSIYGKGIDYYGGYERERRSYYLLNSNEDDRYEYVRDITLNGENKYHLADYSCENLEKRQEELRINYEFGGNGILIPYGEDYIFNPMLFKPGLSRYNNEEHHYPRKKNHYRNVTYAYEVIIPEGYTIENLPENKSFETEDFGFSVTYVIEEGVLKVNIKYHYSLLRIDTERFEEWNDFSSQLQAATTENVILKKN